MKKYTLIIITILMSACSVCKVIKRTTIQEIQFGHGGGFAGSVTTYTLKPNGKLLRQDELISKLPCDTVDLLFELAEQLPRENYVHPGNTYSFIRLVSGDEVYYYAWPLGESPDSNVFDLFTKLNRQL